MPKEIVLSFKQKGRLVCLGDFNDRVHKAVDVDCHWYVWGADL